MWNPNSYQLIDFGDGKKFESFAGTRVVRPCPAAIGIPPSDRAAWSAADLRFEPDRGWLWSNDPSEDWRVPAFDFMLGIKTSQSGNMGLFPEQYTQWDWLRQLVHRRTTPPRCLNLFAYTGGSTMALAKCGCKVTHVDSSNPSVKWARQNAETSKVDPLGVRWIVEDATRFVEREWRRDHRYELIVLDPPTYGHGVQGENWKLNRDLPDLLTQCVQLLSEEACGILLTGHSEGAEPAKWLYDALARSIHPSISRVNPQEIETGRAALRSSFDEWLDCGYFARWHRP